MVRTSLDPALQTAADAAVRDGLMAYDRSMGGWRGPVGHLSRHSGAAHRLGRRARADRPPAGHAAGLAAWRRARGDRRRGQARLARPGRAAIGRPGAEAAAVVPLSDLGWARPVHDGKPGAAPRRIADVVQPGDVVMVEPMRRRAAARASGKTPGRARRQRGSRCARSRRSQGALVSLDPTTGRVLAMVGGWSFESSQFNRATQAQRQPGTSFKPIVYLTALEKGISPSQRFLDAPIVVDQGAGGHWRPNNYEMDFNGPTPLRVALEKSLNLVTLRVARQIGMDSVADTAIAFHVVENMPRVLPAAIGAVDTTVMREAGAYAGLDAGGREVIPTLIDSVQDRDGHVIWRPSAVDCADCGATRHAAATGRSRASRSPIRRACFSW